MATKRSTKKSGSKAAKGGAKKGKNQLFGGSPIIVTGGSMSVEFNPKFKDSDGLPSLGHKKVKRVDHPDDDRLITAVVVTDRSNPPVELHRYTIPANLNGQCRIVIESD
jgi:hypothetical protein